MAADSDRPTASGPLGVWPPNAVAAELEDIFLDATGLPSGPPPEAAPSRRAQALSRASSSRSRNAPGAIGVLVAVGLAGLAAGTVLVRTPHPAAAQAAVQPSIAVAALPAQAPATALTDTPQMHRAVALVPRRRSEIHATRATRVACRHRCSHTDLMAADRRLRAAYSRAVDAGVPRPVLVAYRNRWANLRHDAVYQPGRVAMGYGAMAGDLNRMADRRRGHRPGRPRFRLWS
jgi:hypothetical protein